MAEGYLKSFDNNLMVYSAGINPSEKVHPLAIKVMNEDGLDISGHNPKDVNQFLESSFDFVITVCDKAKESCPVFMGNVITNLHIGFMDPAEAEGTDDEILEIFRRVRDEIKEEFRRFYENTIRRKN